MATINAIVYKHHFKKNKTANVKFRLTHKREHKYIDTSYYVSQNDVTKNFKIKPVFHDRHLSKDLTVYREILNDLGSTINTLTSDELRNKLVKTLESRKRGSDIQSINFIQFSKKYIDSLIVQDKQNSATPLTTAINHLIDFSSDELPAHEITSRFLQRFEDFLKKPRRIVRKDQFGIERERKTEGISKRGAAKVSANVRLLFNKCKEEYNDEEIGDIVISNNPFAKHKIKIPLKKTERALNVVDIASIRDLNLSKSPFRENLGRDMFMLSFYLCGMNSVDIYNELHNMKGEVFGYERSKTKHRDGGSYMELKIPDEAKTIIEKYAGVIKKRYSNSRNFNKAINIGLNSIAPNVYLTNLTHYFARHSFATIAHNICGYRLDQIEQALNHAPKESAITNLYVKTDWSIILRIQEDVLNTLVNDKIITMTAT